MSGWQRTSVSQKSGGKALVDSNRRSFETEQPRRRERAFTKQRKGMAFRSAYAEVQESNDLDRPWSDMGSEIKDGLKSVWIEPRYVLSLLTCRSTALMKLNQISSLLFANVTNFSGSSRNPQLRMHTSKASCPHNSVDFDHVRSNSDVYTTANFIHLSERPFNHESQIAQSPPPRTSPTP
jgi:hypothetical protein